MSVPFSNLFLPRRHNGAERSVFVDCMSTNFGEGCWLLQVVGRSFSREWNVDRIVFILTF